MKAYTISSLNLASLSQSPLEPCAIAYSLTLLDALAMAQNLLAHIAARVDVPDSNGKVSVEYAYVRFTTTAVMTEIVS